MIKKNDDDNKDVAEKVKFEEEQLQVTEEEDSEPPTVVVYYNGKKDVQHANETMVVVEVVKTDIVFFNQKEIVVEAYHVSADQTTTVYVEEQTMEVTKTEDETSQSIYLQASTDQAIVISVEEHTIEVAKTKVVISNQKEDVDEASEVVDVHSKALIQYFDTQHPVRPDKGKIVLADVFACQYIGRAFNIWTRNMSSPEGVELKKKSIWEQITFTQ
ncbi:hypothetical protein GIB67_021970 [Kingdonia uniflora]|uniref:Uncharacterized protein n=1 Tax=Kingdonia uniflora TaxID=39325 RepID=A0A7J7P811_9MAGN|nr:hypothetical protein GIB67_021970 [Kingdonia uniflora]